MRTIEAYEYDVVYTGAHDVIKARSQQRRPPAAARHPTRRTLDLSLPMVRRNLEAQPDRWFTYAELMRATGLSEGVVRSAVRRLALRGLAVTVRSEHRRVGGAYRFVRSHPE